MFTEEFGYAPGSKAMKRELEEEFGPAVKKLEEEKAHKERITDIIDKERQARQDELNESIKADAAYEKLSPRKKAAVEEGLDDYDIDEEDDITLDLPDEKEETFDVEDKDDKTLDLPGEEE